VTEYSEAMVKLGKGEMSKAPVRSQFGWHIIRVDDIRPAQLPSLEELSAEIEQELMQQRMVKFQEDLRAKAKIQ
jgi:peptidyl-prolyl cis-trans isomerase C